MNPIQEINHLIREKIVAALESAQEEGLINYEQIPEFIIEVPREKGHGDFACNAAMILAREAKMAPRQIAQIIVNAIDLGEQEQ